MHRLADARDWLGLLHLGVAQVHAGDLPAAQDAWQRSARMSPSPWAFRNLAALALADKRVVEAQQLLRRAVLLRPDLPDLTLELLDALLADGNARDALSVIDKLPAGVRRHSRICLAEGRAAVAVEDLARADAVLQRASVPSDLREGEDILHQFWYDVETLRRALYSGQPVNEALRREVRRTAKVPWQFEFRMSTVLPTS